MYGRVEIADRQQAALEGLAAERAERAREREAFARQVQALQSGVQEAARAAVAEGLAGAAVEGVAAVRAATGPLLSRLAVAEQAGQADATVTGLVLLGWLASAAVPWWDAGAIQAARVEKSQLQAEVAEMQASRDEWAKAGFLAKLTRCSPGNRPCVRVDERAGPFGDRSDYRVLLGY